MQEKLSADLVQVIKLFYTKHHLNMKSNITFHTFLGILKRTQANHLKQLVAGYRRMGVWLRRYQGGDSIHGGRPISCDRSGAPPRIFPFLRRLRLQTKRDQPICRNPHPQS